MPKLNFQFETFLIQKTIFNFQLKRGFSLIELMIVVSIGVIISFVGVASYFNFAKSTVLKNAAEMLKSDLRLTQSKALAGDKSTTNCAAVGTTLLAWYMTIDQNATQYTINSDCLNGAGEQVFVFKTINLPQGVRIESTNFSFNVNVFFQTLDSIIYFKNASDSLPYFDSNKFLKTPLNLNADLTVTFVNDTGDRYQILVKPAGEISEKKI